MNTFSQKNQKFTSDFLSRTEKSEKGKIDLIKVKILNKSPRNPFGPSPGNSSMFEHYNDKNKAKTPTM